MYKKATYLFLFLFSLATVVAQENKVVPFDRSTLNDGPFIFIKQDSIIEKSIVKGEVITRYLPKNSIQTEFTPEPSTYKNVKNIAALSDIHGQYDLAVTLLKNNKIIDRGDKVHETLLLVYKLEQQAKKQGGQVHFLLGNHEYMVLHNDLRYIHRKYRHTTRLLRITYDQLYGKNTVLGRWLRSKSTIVKINADYFLHGGISKDFITTTGFSSDSIHQVNATMRAAIDRTKEEMKLTDFYTTYFSSKGPVWYRGYFYDNLEETEIDDILHSLDSKHIVVGHCSNKEVVQLYNHKIYGVDSSLKLGEYGEILLIKNKRYQRRTLKGKRKQFSKLDSENSN